jgi:putative GTP pyrophosphokinase
MDFSDTRVAREVANEISSELERVGLFFRIFSRVKSSDSATTKIAKKNYQESLKKLQDPIGVRVTLYFLDDLELATDALTDIYKDRIVDKTIDLPEEKMFHPKRINIVLRLSETHAKQVRLIRENPKYIDNTFELQLRTVLSEGWHEVEHDLRYKCLEDWNGHQDLSRTLNGLVATLENCDWSMLQLFDQLSLRHYREQNWSALIRSKFRLRFTQSNLSSTLIQILNSDQNLARSIFRLDRTRLLLELARKKVSLPITPDNITYASNHFLINNEAVRKATPTPIQEELERRIGISNNEFS